jgi:hypothetical protein
MDDGASGVPILTGDGTENFTAEGMIGVNGHGRAAQSVARPVVSGYIDLPVVSLTLSPAAITEAAVLPPAR